MLYKAILKGIDNDIYGLLSFMYDDMVNKISKQDTPYTMAEGLEAKNKTKAMESLKELLEVEVEIDGRKMNIGEYIKNKPYLNRIVYNRKYTEGTKTESKGDSIQVQKLKLLSKYKNAKELTKEYESNAEIDKEKYLIDKKIEVPINLSLNVGERLTPEQVKENKEITERNKPVNAILSKIDKLNNKFFEETKKLSTIKFGKNYEENKSRKEIDPKEAASYDKLKSKLDKDIQKEIDKIDKIKGQKESKTIKVFNEQYKQDVNEFYKKKSLIRNLFDGKKPKKGLLYWDKAKAKLKEIGKVGTPKSTDSPLLQHLNSKTPKAKGGTVAPNETNFDILVFDLRRTMGMILNAFGGEYKEVVGRILEELKKSLKAEFERIKSTDKDFYGADRTLRDTKVDESVKEQTATTLNFLKKLNSIISSKITKKDVIDTFEDSTISKQKLMSMIVNPPNKTYTVSDSGEKTKKEATYRNYLLPRKGSEGELIFSKKKITGNQFDKFEVLESKLTAKKLKEIRVALIAVGIQRYIPTKTKGKLRQRLEEYSSNLENIMVLFNRKVEAALQLKLDFESKVDKTKTKLQRNLSQGEVPDSFIAPTKEFIASIEEMFSAKNKENELIDELSEMIEEIRAKIGKPMKPREREEPEQSPKEESPKEESKEIVEELDVKHSKLVELQEKQMGLLDAIDAYREVFREMLSDGIEEKFERTFIEEHKKGLTEFKNELATINTQIRAITGSALQIKLVVDKYGIPTPESIKDIRAKKESGKYDIDRVIEGLKQVKRILGAKEMMPKDKR
jgi:nitrogen regulatory protein PII